MQRMLDIPHGTVTLHDARTGTRRQVTLQPFQLADAPVADAEGIPHHGITWFDAVELCNSLSQAAGASPAYVMQGRSVHWDVTATGYRLPTEAEWEHACRAGTLAPTYGDLADIAWTAEDHTSGPQPVRRKSPNGFGLYDTLGNVWEWCWDFADPARYWDYRTLRGGGWADQPWSVRASVRRGSAPDVGLEDVGLRLARGPVGTPGGDAAQGWSAAADRRRADIRGPIPFGWTPYRELLTRPPAPPRSRT